MGVIVTIVIFFIIPTLKWQLVAVTILAAVRVLMSRHRQHENAQFLNFTPRSDEQNFIMFLALTAFFTAIILMLHGLRYFFRKTRHQGNTSVE